MGPDQEGLLISVLETATAQGHHPSRRQTWTKTPPTFLDVRKEVESRIEDGCKVKLALKLAATFQYGIFDRPQPPISSDYSL